MLHRKQGNKKIYAYVWNARVSRETSLARLVTLLRIMKIKSITL